MACLAGWRTKISAFVQRLRVTALLSTLGYALAVLGLVTLHSDQLNRLVARVVPAKPYAVPTFEVVLDGEAASKPLAVHTKQADAAACIQGLRSLAGAAKRLR